ncbi:MAG: metallopeptidase family protein [Acidimicrobiia bacterium]|nr:metallopeptidase family protein [Acidimicrobiia bacterium]
MVALEGSPGVGRSRRSLIRAAPTLIAMPVSMSLTEFEDLVAEALDSIPDDLAKHMENIAVQVEDWPTRSQQQGHPGMLLGLYEGVSLTRRGPLSYQGAMPDRITIFRGPHLRITSDRDQLRRRIAITVVHEVGHHFGISDERLDELGWT